MIKSEITEDIKFPALYQNKKNASVVVFFTAPAVGFVVRGGAEYEIGHDGSNDGCFWIPCTNNSEWERFSGTISLKNKN
ncbi:hypothetical protein [Paremcibacter congregatus]|uniref:hypothetical protein n=1 Tax=Paremcibacter congregatus TaxID=2043170 RepID=UPI0030ED0302|tara:strand:- start:1356 stop:1592 length:237 start_codon:yes stop_codon:yes gene_type:complete